MKAFRFRAQIESGDRGGAYVQFPYDVEKEFGTKEKIPVQAKLDGVPYTGSLIKYGSPRHLLPILKAVRERIGKAPGDTVEVELWKEDGPRVLEIPTDLKEGMRKGGVMPIFDRLSYTQRKEYCRWITDAKREHTRLRRLQKAIEMLKKGVGTPD